MPEYPAKRGAHPSYQIKDDHLFVAKIRSVVSPERLPGVLYFHPDFNLESGAIISTLAAHYLRPLPVGKVHGMDRPVRAGDRTRVTLINPNGDLYDFDFTVKQIISSFPGDVAGYERVQLPIFIQPSLDELEDVFDVRGLLSETNHRASRVGEDTLELVLFARDGNCYREDDARVAVEA